MEYHPETSLLTKRFERSPRMARGGSLRLGFRSCRGAALLERGSGQFAAELRAARANCDRESCRTVAAFATSTPSTCAMAQPRS